MPDLYNRGYLCKKSLKNYTRNEFQVYGIEDIQVKKDKKIKTNLLIKSSYLSTLSVVRSVHFVKTYCF